MNTPTSATPTTSSSITPASPAPFVPLDFLQQFVAGINGGVVLRNANGSSILSTLKEGDIITPGQVSEAFDIIAGYFKHPGLSSEMDVNRVQQYAGFLAEIVKHQNHHGHRVPLRTTAYEMGNAVAALQQVLRAQTPTGKN